MEKAKKCIAALLMPVLLVDLAPAASFGQAGYDLGEVVITATKTEQHQAEIGSCTTVITADEIEKSGKTEVSDILRLVPGVTVVENAGLGSLSLLYLRGGSPGQTMVMIDGVEVKYPMEMDGGYYEFGNLLADNIERIEVVRGPQSTLYGSSAMSGVINIITRKGKGKPRIDLTLRGGSYDTFSEAASLSGTYEAMDYSLAVSRADSSGISIVSGGDEPDGASITNASGNLGFKVFGKGQLNILARYTYGDIDLDDSGQDDPNYTAQKRIVSSKVQFEQPLNDFWEHKLYVSVLDTQRDYRDVTHPGASFEDSTSWYKGNIARVEWQNNIFPVENDTVTAGLDYQDSKGSTFYRSVTSYGPYVSKVAEHTVNNTAFYLQNHYSLGQELFTTIGARLDNHQMFGTESTYKVSLAYLLADYGTRFKANYGTAFRAPSIYQLYSSYGDENMKPEESVGFDIGFDQSLVENRISFGAAYFNNDYDNLIEYVGSAGKYQNVAEVQTKGAEIEMKFIASDNVVVTLNDTYMDTLNKKTGEQLLKRPRNRVNAAINCMFLDSLNTNLIVNHSEGSQQYGGGETDAYTRVDFAFSYRLNDNFKIFGNVDNIFDIEYEEAAGFTRPRASFYAGIKIGL